MPALCSWSGGKDSCLALYRAAGLNMEISTLLCMLHEDGNVSRSHGISRRVLETQAIALRREIVFGSATWGGYESAFIARLKELKIQGIGQAVFGDIDLDAHREWEERVCDEADMEAILPLWGEQRRRLVDEFLEAGFRAIIVSVRDKSMVHWLGRDFCEAFIGEAETIGWDACGENGEFHTFVYDGPNFENPVQYKLADVHQEKNYFFAPLLPSE